MNTKYMKRLVLAGVLGIGFATALILYVAVQEKFGSNCSVHLSEKRELVDFNDGRGLVSVFVRGEKTVEWCGLLLFSVPPSLIILFLLSLLTYWAKDELFRAWWNLAKWWVPVIIVVTLWVENAGGGGGWGMNSGAFDVFFIGIFYFIFIVVSLIKIVRAYLRTKKTS